MGFCINSWEDCIKLLIILDNFLQSVFVVALKETRPRYSNVLAVSAKLTPAVPTSQEYLQNVASCLTYFYFLVVNFALVMVNKWGVNNWMKSNYHLSRIWETILLEKQCQRLKGPLKQNPHVSSHILFIVHYWIL